MSGSAKEKFNNALGDSALWDDTWECLSKIDPEIFEASVKLKEVPRKKNHLSAKMQALVALTVDCNSTHLYVEGIRNHVKAAAAAGASLAEVLEVLELSSTLGIHACNIGIPTLVQVMKEENIYDNHSTAGKPFDDRRLALKEDFSKKRGVLAFLLGRLPRFGSRVLRGVHRVFISAVDEKGRRCIRSCRSISKSGQWP